MSSTNIPNVFVTFVVLKLVKRTSVSALHLLNIQNILFTFDVSKLNKSSDVNELHPANILFISDAFVDTIQASLKSGEKVAIAGFGTFDVSNRKARTGRNPHTGEEIKIAASKTPKFKAGKSFKDMMN